MNKIMKNLLIGAGYITLSYGLGEYRFNTGFTQGHEEGIKESEQNQAKYTLRIHKNINKKGYLDNISLEVFDPKKNDSEEYFFMSENTSLSKILNQQPRTNKGEIKTIKYHTALGHWENVQIQVNPQLIIELYQNHRTQY